MRYPTNPAKCWVSLRSTQPTHFYFLGKTYAVLLSNLDSAGAIAN
ncbi:hypothetical protein [Nostoc sp.]